MTWSDWELPFLPEVLYNALRILSQPIKYRDVYLSTICYEIGAIFKDPEWFFFNSEKIVSHNADYEFWVYL